MTPKVAQCTVCQAGAIVIKQEVEYTPIKVDDSVEDVLGQESLTEEILHLEDTLKEARENVTRAQEKTRQRLKSASGKTVFKVGEKVWRQNKRSQQRKGGKLEPHCLRPFTIVNLQGKSADLQGEKWALIHKVSIDHLKHCKEEGPRIPQNIKGAKPMTRPSVIVFAGEPASSPAPPATGPAAAVQPPPSSPAPPATGPASAVPPPSSPAPPATGPAAAVQPPPSSPAPPATGPASAVPPPSSPAPPATGPAAAVPPPSSPAPPATGPAAAVPPPSSPAPPATGPAAAVPPPSSPAPPATGPAAAVPPPPSSPAPPATGPAAAVPPPSSPAPPATGPAAAVPPPSSPAPPATATPTQVQTLPDKIVEDAWAGNGSHVLMSKIGPYKMYYWDIRQIRPNMELESEVINAYLAVKVKEFNQENPRGQRATFIDTFEMTTIWNNGTSRLKIDPLDYDVILGIVNDYHHWTLTFAESILRSEEDISFATTTQAIEEHRRNIATTLIQQIGIGGFHS
ncbi:hypothetical protein JOQ06_014947 [Pogonophryne albipinna]|uniref:Uncharacterized protein n=1 Tax=Pogonophryne albipinna TaxID=1090488 RepID=A0AAD6AM50_9TELE|nr:hypothetical protein JOQ06_014947 [Pogonophryne albipinna]